MQNKQAYAGIISKTITVALGVMALIAVALCCFAGRAYAQADPGAAASESIPFTHTMKTSAAVNLEGITYTISAVPTDLTGANASLVTTGVREVPNAVVPRDVVITPAADSAAPASTEWTKTYQVDKTLSELFGDASIFAKPGVYLFDVTETAAGGSALSNDGATPTPNNLWTNDSSTYRLRVYVAYDESNGDVLDYYWWTVESLTDSQKKDAVAFASSYDAWQTLSISKEVEGDYADKTYEFPFEITLYVPEWYDPNIKAIATPAGATADPALSQQNDAGVWTGVYKVSLHHGESVSFSVPVGTRYKIDEFAGAANKADGVGIEYSPDIAWTVSIPEPPEVLPDHQEHLNDYSLSDLKQISANLAAEGENSPFWTEFNGYVASGETWTSPELVLDGVSGIDPNLSDEDKVMQLRIIGINHDDKADNSGKVGLTMMAAAPLPKKYPYHATPGGYYNEVSNLGGWPAMDLYATMNSGEIWNMIPSGLQASIVPVKKKSTALIERSGSWETDFGTVESTDKLFIPSYIEIVGSLYETPFTSDRSEILDDKPFYAQEGTQYDFFATRVSTGEYGLVVNAPGLTTSCMWLRSSGLGTRYGPMQIWHENEYYNKLFIDDDYSEGIDIQEPQEVVVCFCI